MRNYGHDFLATFERGVWELREKMRLGLMERSRVMDIGCGFGWQAMLSSVPGNNEVVANDLRDDKTSVVNDRTATVREMGYNVKVSSLTGDICQLKIPPESIDVVHSHQCIEHVHDLELMFSTIFAILKQGGRCVISNSSNALHQRTRIATEAMWHRRDNDWDYIDKLKQQRPRENAGIEPYAVVRQRLVRQSNPVLPDEQIKLIVDATAGLTQTNIERIARQYHPGYVLPVRPAHAWCRNPISKEYCERLLNPFDVATIAESTGLHTQVRHLFRRFPLRVLNGIRLRGVNECLFNLRDRFVILGVKE